MDTNEHAQQIFNSLIQGLAANGSLPTAGSVDGYIDLAFICAERFAVLQRKRNAGEII